MVQGTMSGVGKSTITTALCRILSDEGYLVAPFKSQNMSRFLYGDVSRAQALQAVAARCPVTADINPVVLVPKDDTHSEVRVRGVSHGLMGASQYYEFAPGTALRAATASLLSLVDGYDIVVLEGAGSPAEINLPFDMANMMMAEAASARIIMVSDIERGGCFAQMAGTVSLLEQRHKEMVCGFVINKFRGDDSVLVPGISAIRDMTGIPVLGVVPYMETRLPAEDSLDTHHMQADMGSPELDAIIDEVARRVRDCLDMNAILGMVRA